MVLLLGLLSALLSLLYVGVPLFLVAWLVGWEPAEHHVYLAAGLIAFPAVLGRVLATFADGPNLFPKHPPRRGEWR